MPRLHLKQWLLLLLALAGWVTVYVLQEFDFTRLDFRVGQYEQGRIPDHAYGRFIINKSIRFILNDLFSILFIYGLFQEKRYVQLALIVMAIGAFILLPTYLIIAIKFQEAAFHQLQFLHRITMNPVLMLLLIPAIFYSKQLKT